MKKSLKDRWIKALLSGEYKQGKGRLKKGEGYCCLGVLCEVGNIPYTGSSGFPGNSGLRIIVELGLASMNDEGVPFDVIAGFIKENVECE